MSESELVQTLAAVVRSTSRNASDLTMARAIVTGLSAAGYEIVRTREVADAGAEAPAGLDRPGSERVRKAG